MTKVVKQKYPDFQNMKTAYQDSISRRAKSEKIEFGGDTIGFYTDDCGRVRPITEPKSYQWIWNLVSVLEVCIDCEREEFYDAE